jgi:hypothetical protein
MKNSLTQSTQKPLTGRIRLVVPFLPFTPTECTILMHRFILDFIRDMRSPIDLRSGAKKFFGHCRISVVDDGKVCAELSKQYYMKDLGARSLEAALTEVEYEFSMLYSNMKGLVTQEMNVGVRQGFFGQAC